MDDRRDDVAHGLAWAGVGSAAFGVALATIGMLGPAVLAMLFGSAMLISAASVVGMGRR